MPEPEGHSHDSAREVFECMAQKMVFGGTLAGTSDPVAMVYAALQLGMELMRYAPDWGNTLLDNAWAESEKDGYLMKLPEQTMEKIVRLYPVKVAR